MSGVIPGNVLVGRISSTQKDFPALGFWLEEAVGNVSVRVVQDGYGNTTKFSVITSIADSAGGRAVAVGVYDAAPRCTIGLVMSDERGDIGTFYVEGFEISAQNSFSCIQQTCFFVGKDGDVVETRFSTMDESDFDGMPASVRAWDYYDASTTVGGVSLEAEGSLGRITIPSNPSALTRLICVAVSDKNGNDALHIAGSIRSNEIVVVQAGTAAGATVTASPASVDFSAEGGAREILVESENAGTIAARTAESWISASATGTTGRIEVSPNTSSSARSGTATFYGSLGGSATVTVAQEAKFAGSIPEGNMPPESSGNVGGGGSGGGGGLVGDGEFSFFDENKLIAERGRDLVFENEASVEGGVAEDGGEAWTVKFTMRRARVNAFVRQARLFLHSAWQPVRLPSRNKPTICGWDVRYTRGGNAAVTIKYKVSAGVAYHWKSENSAPDTRSERIATGVAERPISECDALWPGEGNLQRRAEIVNILKKILAYDAVAGDEVIARLNEAAKEYLGGGSGGDDDDDAQSRAALAAASDDDDDEGGYGSIKQLKARFPEVVQELSNGTDSFLAYTAEAVLIETSDTRMTTDVPGVYDDPSFQQIRLPSAEAWLLVADEIECDTGGIYKRTRRWQAAERRSACYGG